MPKTNKKKTLNTKHNPLFLLFYFYFLTLCTGAAYALVVVMLGSSRWTSWRVIRWDVESPMLSHMSVKNKIDVLLLYKCWLCVLAWFVADGIAELLVSLVNHKVLYMGKHGLAVEWDPLSGLDNLKKPLFDLWTCCCIDPSYFFNSTVLNVRFRVSCLSAFKTKVKFCFESHSKIGFSLKWV